MVVNQCVEQGVYVVLVLAVEKDHRPLSSTQLSRLLDVSDSYLKKILRKLVLAGIIVSNPGKNGGFQLSRSVEEITMLDVYAALEGEQCRLMLSGVGERIFVYGRGFAKGVTEVADVFDRANAAFCEELRKLRLSDILMKKYYQNGSIDFEAVIRDMEK